MLMHNPPHPGEILCTLCLEPLGSKCYGCCQGPWGEPEDVVQSLEWAHRYQSRDGGKPVHRV